MALITIQQGSEVISSDLNDNFVYLEGEITNVGSRVTTTQTNLESLSSTLNASINSLDAELSGDIQDTKDELQASINEIDGKVDAIAFFPDYSKGISISIGRSNNKYKVTADGWVYATCGTGDSNYGFYVNDKKVSTHQSSQYGNVGTKIGTTFPVSKDDEVHGDNNGSGYFFPMKGAE